LFGATQVVDRTPCEVGCVVAASTRCCCFFDEAGGPELTKQAVEVTFAQAIAIQ